LYGAEADFDFDFLQLFLAQLEDLVKAFLLDCSGGLLEELILPLNDRPANGAFSLGITLQAFLQRHIENKSHAGHTMFPRQLQQVSARLRGERCGIDHAQALDIQALLDQEVQEREGLHLKTLVALIITHQRARLVRRDDLSWPEVARCEGGFSANRRAAQHHDGGTCQANNSRAAGCWSLILGHGSCPHSRRAGITLS
jgi:hypothetical protein